MTPRERLARSAAELDPLKQGALDGLCGLYSIINAIALAVYPYQPLSDQHQARLFRSGIGWLKRRVSLSDAVLNGLTASTWRALARFLITKYRREARLPLRLHLPLQAERQPCSAFIRDALSAQIDRGAPVLLSLDTTYDHFTVACRYSADRLTLFDSNGAAWVRWGSLGGQSARHYISRSGAMAIGCE